MIADCAYRFREAAPASDTGKPVSARSPERTLLVIISPK
jgi:hypothetical protein